MSYARRSWSWVTNATSTVTVATAAGTVAGEAPPRLPMVAATAAV
ncbi:hypothetical protein ACFVEM_08535 [Streptomyces tendae]